MDPLRRLLDSPRVRRRGAGGDATHDPRGRCVVLWMQRAQRGVDNPALDLAIDAANLLRLPVVVHLGHMPGYPRANARHYAFLFDGVADVERAVRARGCAFAYRPWPNHRLDAFCAEVAPALVVGDENPLRETERWRQTAAARLRVPLYTVDADVVVPSALFPKEEYGARTLRPKLHRVLAEYLVPGHEPRAHVRWPEGAAPRSEPCDAHALLERFPLDRSATAVADFRGGTRAGLDALEAFVRERLGRYVELRNRPEHEEGTSRLSPWLHFGHLGPRLVALRVLDAGAPDAAKQAFLEQLIVRRELCVNHVSRNPAYDRLEGAPSWARATLEKHADDPRPHVYDEAVLDAAATHDPLWNAAQRQMRDSGHMHNHMRMYWAKKILEWSETPARAFEHAIALNDRYELDGRDPNGYAGIGWAIGGRHDRPWGPERPIFGTIRYMSGASTGRKFDSKAYVARWGGGADGAGGSARSVRSRA